MAFLELCVFHNVKGHTQGERFCWHGKPADDMISTSMWLPYLIT